MIYIHPRPVLFNRNINGNKTGMEKCRVNWRLIRLLRINIVMRMRKHRRLCLCKIKNSWNRFDVLQFYFFIKIHLYTWRSILFSCTVYDSLHALCCLSYNLTHIHFFPSFLTQCWIVFLFILKSSYFHFLLPSFFLDVTRICCSKDLNK